METKVNHINSVSENIDYSNKIQTIPCNPESTTVSSSSSSSAGIETPSTSAETDSVFYQSQIADLKSLNQQLETLLLQKDEQIQLQKRELAIVEHEKQSINRTLTIANRDKESAVVRYAIVEKSILELRTKNDSLQAKENQSRKLIDSLNTKLTSLQTEKETISKNWRQCYRNCEQLRSDLTALETKLKWNQVKLKQDQQLQLQQEQRIVELTAELRKGQQNPTANDMVASDSILVSRKQEQESEAQIIMWKHLCSDKDKEIQLLGDKFAKLKFEKLTITDNYEKLIEQEKLINFKFLELSTINETNQQKLLDQSGELNRLAEQLTTSNEQLDQAKYTEQIHLEQLKRLQTDLVQFREQQLELIGLRDREQNLLDFIKDYTEKIVDIENQLILSNARASGLILENEKLKLTIRENIDKINELNERHRKFQQKRTDEMKLMGQLLTERTNQLDAAKIDFDNRLGDVEANNQKYTQIIKELNRKITLLHNKQNGDGNDELPKQNGGNSKTQLFSSGNGDSIGDVVGDKQTTQSSIRRCNDPDLIQGPSTQILIERIVRLQKALARKTEKIEFLENHCANFINNRLQKKS